MELEKFDFYDRLRKFFVNEGKLLEHKTLKKGLFVDGKGELKSYELKDLHKLEIREDNLKKEEKACLQIFINLSKLMNIIGKTGEEDDTIEVSRFGFKIKDKGSKE